MQNHIISVRLLNQSLERYLDRVDGWKDVMEETEEKMKNLVEDQYNIKAAAQQVNTTVALRLEERRLNYIELQTQHDSITTVIIFLCDKK